MAVLTFKHKRKVETFEVEDGELTELWQEWVVNGFNPSIKNLTFEHFNRALETTLENVEDVQEHFIYGQIECILQSDDCPVWIYDYEERDVQITWEPTAAD